MISDTLVSITNLKGRERFYLQFISLQNYLHGEEEGK